ncbi:hypothetical protein NDU88_011669 [Pleurodeles waltl]|uniref:Uncharacterized protein n=1 Tax=Pleurodeles waltl TaxID=8319 RepID=A0AAV7R120_PLEWA|nr:hypothetical protein NDU88_011669 [Pleurodeles waltl]
MIGGRVMKSLKGPEGPAPSVSWSPGASAMRSGRTMKSLKGPEGPAPSVSWSLGTSRNEKRALDETFKGA